MTKKRSNFINAADISDAVYLGKAYTIVASMWESGPRGGYVRYSSEHIPTSFFCDPQSTLSGVPGSEAGRNPLPDTADVEEALHRWGVREGRPVVVYDQGPGLFAGRAWWVLRWAGLPDVRILNGGLAEWDRLEYPIIGGPGNIAFGGDQEATFGSMPTASIDDVRNFDGILVDTRQPNRFAGRREGLDLKAGHIPGAVNVPMEDLVDKRRVVLSPEAIRERFARVGVTSAEDVIVYSGSGLHSSYVIAAMEYAGMGVPAHFVEGWSLWAADPANPVERGD
ncbi:sulfurtransferase [Corynebacterium uterequi]|nr:sulfurtransferase [Corynebacterium uterequi]